MFCSAYTTGRVRATPANFTRRCSLSSSLLSSACSCFATPVNSSPVETSIQTTNEELPIISETTSVPAIVESTSLPTTSDTAGLSSSIGSAFFDTGLNAGTLKGRTLTGPSTLTTDSVSASSSISESTFIETQKIEAQSGKLRPTTSVTDPFITPKPSKTKRPHPPPLTIDVTASDVIITSYTKSYVTICPTGTTTHTYTITELCKGDFTRHEIPPGCQPRLQCVSLVNKSQL